MAEADEVKVENIDVEESSQTTREEKIRAARRKFLRQMLAVTSGVALAELLPSALLEAASQGPGCAPGPNLIPVNEISQSKDGRLQAVIKVTNGRRVVPGRSDQPMLRYYAGYNPGDLTKPVWPTSNNAGPGPTLRCEVGNSVEITFVNNVDVSQFSGSLYSGEKGTASGCDEVQAGRFYPANDKFPNCFHASSAANMHFHGTHVTPSTTGDNVLVNVQPQTNLTNADIKQIQQWFQPIFNKGEAVQTYNEISEDWRKSQMGPSRVNPKGLIGQYDATAPFKGGRGLPPDLRLWPKNDVAIRTPGEWPQYFVGSYPICFRIPRYGSGVVMGQAPGTHWYHSHKHGSTSVNLFNGLAGALIIEDNSPGRIENNTPAGYDYVLRTFYEKQGQKLDQVVLVFQQITDTIPLLVGSPAPPPVLVNGQKAPTIEMKPGQIQLWRMINATVAAFLTAEFKICSGNAQLQCRQTAQDGVQFAQINYMKQPLGNKGQDPIGDKMAPGNRIDLLVQAPMGEGMHVMQIPGTPPTPILYIRVTDRALSSQMQFPDQSDFPILPPFLGDITEFTSDRPPITYGSLPPSGGTGRQLKQWSINGKQFQEGTIDQPVQLGAAEEWTIYNADGPPHPFHIHINPFQIVEVFDPDKMTKPLVLDPPYIWWDTFAIPSAKDNVKGYFKMRSKFVDFTGVYVQHCHILAHEDRGMMQLVEVCKDIKNCGKRTNLKHH